MAQADSMDYAIIYSAERAYEADLIRGILRSNGVTPHHVADYAAGLFGVLVNMNVAVRTEDIGEARDIFLAFGINPDDPQKKYVPGNILRTINHFLPAQNRWVKLYAALAVALIAYSFITEIWRVLGLVWH